MLSDRAAAEMIRWGASVHMQKRYTARGTRIGDDVITTGETVLVLVASASRDPERFADSDRFDITRDEVSALAFGAGIHRCLGSAPAQLEISVVATKPARRFPDIHSAGEVSVRRSANIRKLKNLPVRRRLTRLWPNVYSMAAEGLHPSGKDRLRAILRGII